MPTTHLSDCLKPLDETLSDFCAGRAEFEQRVESLLKSLDEVSSDLRQEASQIPATARRGNERGVDVDGPLRDQLLVIQKDRETLNAELAEARQRAIELERKLDAQHDEATRQQGQLNDELRRLRHVVERQAELWTTRQASGHVTVQASATPVMEQAPSVPSDPVIQAVMAQFARLKQI
jgi:chromosome segregation ATPase